MDLANTSRTHKRMPIDNRVMNPAIAQQLFRKSEQLKRRRAGKPAALESFPRVIKTITGLWRYREGQKYLEELIELGEGTYFPDQHRVFDYYYNALYLHSPRCLFKNCNKCFKSEKI